MSSNVVLIARKKRTNSRKGGKNTSNKNKKNAHRRTDGNLVVRDDPRFPNEIKMRPIHNRVIRYLCTAALQGQDMTAGQMLTSVLACTNASTAAIRIFGGVKLRRISMYFAATDFSGSANNLAFSWRGALNGPETVITDRGTATKPACIKVTPPRDSPCGWWYDSTSPEVNSSICRFWIPVGTIIDIDFEFCLDSGSTSSTTLGAVSTFTGVGYLRLFGTTTGLDPDGGVDIVRL